MAAAAAAAASSSKPNSVIRRAASSIVMADAASWYCAFVLLSLILLSSVKEEEYRTSDPVRGSQFSDHHRRRPCDEIYVVGEGETLNTISDKCGDPFIVEQNPHIQDPDDVFPGLVIKITPAANSISKPRKLLWYLV